MKTTIKTYLLYLLVVGAMFSVGVNVLLGARVQQLSRDMRELISADAGLRAAAAKLVSADDKLRAALRAQEYTLKVCMAANGFTWDAATQSWKLAAARATP